MADISIDDELKRQLFRGIFEAVGDAAKKYLAGDVYGRETPLTKIVASVITKHEEELKATIEEAVVYALSGDFREQLREAVAHKIAKTVIAKSEGEIEKRANDLRSSPEFRAKLTLAITGAINAMAKP